MADTYDIIIIGGGPAGFTAGIYAARARMKTLLMESFSIMGQATMTDNIENYPGLESVSGFELLGILRKQAEKFGTVITEGTVRALAAEDAGGAAAWKVDTGEAVYRSHTVRVASGARPKKLGIPGEDEFIGRGVSYCATCDGAFFKGRDIAVIGGGNSAVEEAIYLTRFASKVTIVHRRDRLRASKIVQEQAMSNAKIDFAWNTVPERIEGKEKVERIVLKDVATGKARELACEGVFIFAGWQPNTDFLKGTAALGEKGHVIVDQDMKTSAKGIFACGDCCHKTLHQVVTACGDGATAAYTAQQYVEKLKGVAYE